MVKYAGPERREGLEFAFDNTDKNHESALFRATGFTYYSEPQDDGRYFVPRIGNLPAGKLKTEGILEPDCRAVLDGATGVYAVETFSRYVLRDRRKP